MSDLDTCSLVSDFTLLKAAVRGQRYQDAKCTLLKHAIQLKLAMYCRGCPQSRAVEAGFKNQKPTILGFKNLKSQKFQILVFFRF